VETQRVFVTGGTGFIGRHFVEEIARQGHVVTCLIRNPKKMAELDHIGVRFVRGNLINIGKVKEHIERQDIVFHLAAIRGERKISWAEYYKVNVEATQRLLEISANTGVSRFVYASSVGVHSTSPTNLPADEKTPYCPDSFYHKSKMLAEHVVFKWTKFLHTTVIRPTITYGPNDVGFLYRVAKIAKNGFFPVVGQGENKIHILYVKGLVETLINAMSANNASGEIYIIADKCPIKFRDLVQFIGAYINRKLKIVSVPFEPFLKLTEIYDELIAPIVKGKSMVISFKLLSLPWYYSIRKVVSELRYRPYHTEDRVKDTIKGYLNQGWL